MKKQCVILDGKIINVGDWGYQYIEIDGEQVAQNPLPDGATVEERDFEYDADRGWYEVGTTAPTSDKNRIALLQDAVDFILMNY